MRKFVTISTLICLFCARSSAQQTPLFSQYILNEFIINPSVAGLDGMTTINLSGRRQWLGYEYGPETYAACVSTRLLKTNNAIRSRTMQKNRNRLKRGSSGRIGLGGAIISDKNGAVNRTSFHGTYAYHIFVNNSQLSFGLSLLAQQFTINSELAQFRKIDGMDVDPLTGLLGKSAYIPDAAFGMHYSTKKYSFGMSAYQLFQSPIKFGNSEVNDAELKQVRHYNYHGSYKNHFHKTPEWEYEPSVLIRMTEGLQTSADLALRFIYNNEYWAGVSYRTSGEFIVLMGFKFNQMYLGYSFDYGFNEFSSMSWGSHEVMFAIKLGDSNRRYRYWERY